jgi:chorismate mutase
MSNIIRFRNALALSVCLLVWGMAGGVARAQDPAAEPPFDYNDAAIGAAADGAMNAWVAWQRGDRDLERDVLKAAMADARARIQRSFSALLNYLEKRKAYSESVAAYIEHYRPETTNRKPVVTIETVNREQLGLFRATLANVQAREDSLRDSPEWGTIRRKVAPDTSELAGVQSARRAELPIDLPFSQAEPPRQLSSIVYRDSERQLRDVLQKLWTHYYQALDDAAEQRPGGALPLVASVTPAAAPVPVATAPASATPVAGVPLPTTAAQASASTQTVAMLVGTWRYAENSRQFNGVEEPRQVLLEIWTEKSGAISARYRGTLSDFDGPHDVDLALHQVPATKNSKEVTLSYKSAGQDAEGHFTLEGPDAGGLNLMVVHTGGAGVPKGREIVVRR